MFFRYYVQLTTNSIVDSTHKSNVNDIFKWLAFIFYASANLVTGGIVSRVLEPRVRACVPNKNC